MQRLVRLTSKAILGLIPALAVAQSRPPAKPPDPRELLKQSAEAIKQYKSYQLESRVVVDMQGGPFSDRLVMPSSISVKRPDKLRIESTSKAGTVTIVGDGEHTWFYLSSVKKYVKRDAVESPEATVINSGILPKNLPDVNQSIKSVKLAGEDAIDVGGVKTPCWKIETIFDKITLPDQNVTVRDAVQVTWITKDRRLTLQSTFIATINLPGVPEPVEMTQSTNTTKVRLDAVLPDSLFAFTPPAGSEATEDWTLPGIAKPDVVGKPAPALVVKAIDGGDVDLAALKGKVVLLNFWATWCAPCKRELPVLEKLSAEFREQGLAVVGVAVGEDRAVVDKFLKTTGLTYPVVPAEEGSAIVSALSVTAFPTVVLVDRDGNIASYEVGARGEAALRDALRKLGLGPKL
jgi:thiol-disulfide isomerase/thioredoxin